MLTSEFLIEVNLGRTGTQKPKGTVSTHGQEDVHKAVDTDRAAPSSFTSIEKKVFQSIADAKNISNTPEEHYHIGKSETHYDDIGSFLRLNSNDPAIKVSKHSNCYYGSLHPQWLGLTGLPTKTQSTPSS